MGPRTIQPRADQKMRPWRLVCKSGTGDAGTEDGGSVRSVFGNRYSLGLSRRPRCCARFATRGSQSKFQLKDSATMGEDGASGKGRTTNQTTEMKRMVETKSRQDGCQREKKKKKNLRNDRSSRPSSFSSTQRRVLLGCRSGGRVMGRAASEKTGRNGIGTRLLYDLAGALVHF
ncbi:hypothetical protein QR685DRAFT_323038 [Neurospora intermedia]|uniref:Uncharacterized protein n=2 Tax=Neurospora TaxID=5140 RepID=A0ABR3D8K2_NEUIN